MYVCACVWQREEQAVAAEGCFTPSAAGSDSAGAGGPADPLACSRALPVRTPHLALTVSAKAQSTVAKRGGGV